MMSTLPSVTHSRRPIIGLKELDSRRQWHSYLAAILDLIYPRFCYNCRGSLADSANRYLCFCCWRQLPLSRNAICRRCGAELGPGTIEKNSCLLCQAQRFRFAGVRSGGKYQGALRNLLLQFKFHGISELRYPLAAIICRQLRLHPFAPPPELLLPVPLWPAKQQRRGYNQAELLARSVARDLGLPCLDGVLRKIKSSVPQSSLQRRERKNNVAGTFALSPRQQAKICGRIVLLIDDIITSGSTADECAAALKQAGAGKVYVATVAKTMANDND